MPRYDAVVFDNDGILIEPPAYERQLAAAGRAFADHGLDDVDDEHLAAIAGDVSHGHLQSVCEHHGLAVESLWEARDRHDQRFQREDIEAGVRTAYDDITAIADCDVARGVVSNNHHATVEFILDHFGIEHLFSTVYGRERSVAALRSKKPEPILIERACEDLDATDALYVGDRETDVTAADNAGVDSVFVRRDHCRDVAFDVTPTYEIESLHDLPSLLYGDGV